jgi:hypothetical protein
MVCGYCGVSELATVSRVVPMNNKVIVMPWPIVRSLSRVRWVGRAAISRLSNLAGRQAVFLTAVGFALTLPLLLEQVSSCVTTRNARVISGERVEMDCTLWSPWRDTVTLVDVIQGCWCTSASIAPMTIKPWSVFAVRVMFDSRGKAPGPHTIGVRAIVREGIVHELPVRFTVEVVPAEER